MGAPQHSLKVRTEALTLAAGGDATIVAKQLGIPQRTVERWVGAADPAEMAMLAAIKRSEVQRVVLDQVVEVVQGIMVDLKHVGLDDKGAKALQARATTLAILQDKFFGTQQANSSGRFGDGDGSSDPRLRDIGQRILRKLGGDEPPEPVRGDEP